jgi:peptidoglycan/xylan/chitin deacetylase (PgdA/CDA1 family)
MNISSKNDKIGLPPSKVIFTFDDGPNHNHNTTERLLDVLNKYQVKGVFCLLGVNVEKNPEIVRRIYNEGHMIVNHGYSDKIAYFMTDEEFRENILQCQRVITEALGFEISPKRYRPNGGIYNSAKNKIITEEGYVVVPYTMGNVMDPYTTYTEKDMLIKKIIAKIEKQNGGIILLHDGRDGHERNTKELQKNPNSAYNRSWIPEAVEEIIIALLGKGFVLTETFDFN